MQNLSLGYRYNQLGVWKHGVIIMARKVLIFSFSVAYLCLRGVSFANGSIPFKVRNS